MKKVGKLLVIAISVVSLILISGCGVYDEIDLEKAKEEISKLENTNFDFKAVQEYLYDANILFGILEEVSEEKLEEYGINSEYIDKEDGELALAFTESQETESEIAAFYSYIIAKPAEDKKTLLEEQLDHYYQALYDDYSEREDATEEVKEHFKNVMKKEYEGYLIYILSTDNDSAWNQIQEIAHSNIYGSVKQIALDELLTTFSLDKKDVVEHMVYFSDSTEEASLYMIIRPRRQSLEKVKAALDKYMNEYEKEWRTKSPDEYELIQNRTITEVGSYLVYIVSKDNTAVLEAVKNSVIKKD